MESILIIFGSLCSILNGIAVFRVIKVYLKGKSLKAWFIFLFLQYSIISTKFIDFFVLQSGILKLSESYFLLLLFFLFTVVLLLYYKLSKENASHEMYTKNLIIAKQYAEIELLKLELDPHFLFNSLNTLVHLVPKSESNAKSYIQMLSEVYRYILQNKHTNLVLLKHELNFCRIYFALIRIRFGDNINLHIDIENIESESYLIPPMAVQIPIENAIKHNQFSNTHPLTIFLKVIGDEISIENELNASSYSESLQIGLKNLKTRFHILCGKSIRIEKTATKFRIVLPLISSK